MTDEEFEKKWQEVRENVLSNDYEYKRIQDGYKRGSTVNWIIIIGGAMVGSTLPEYLPIKNKALTWLIAIVAGIIVIVLGLWIRSLFISRKTADEVEQEVKIRYRKSIE